MNLLANLKWVDGSAFVGPDSWERYKAACITEQDGQRLYYGMSADEIIGDAQDSIAPKTLRIIEGQEKTWDDYLLALVRYMKHRSDEALKAISLAPFETMRLFGVLPDLKKNKGGRPNKLQQSAWVYSKVYATGKARWTQKIIDEANAHFGCSKDLSVWQRQVRRDKPKMFDLLMSPPTVVH